METFTKLFGSLLVFVYHCFDRIVINGYLEYCPGRNWWCIFSEVLGIRAITKEALGSGRRNTSSGWKRMPGSRRSRCSGPKREFARRTLFVRI